MVSTLLLILAVYLALGLATAVVVVGVSVLVSPESISDEACNLAFFFWPLLWLIAVGGAMLFVWEWSVDKWKGKR